MPNRTIWFPKRQHQHLVSSTSSGYLKPYLLLMDQGGNQDQTGLRSETSADDEAKHNTEKGPKEIAEKQNKAPIEETEIKAKIVASSQQQSNQIDRFDKSDHPVSPGIGQKRTSRTTMPGTTSAPRWCPPGLMPS
jgi:hypothetical protein